MYDKVPALLKQQKIWLNYKDIKSIEAGYNTGLGIALTENTGIVAIDYDKVIKSIKPNGAIEFIDAETEQRILRDIHLLKSYVEISPSNKGLHIYLIASININIKTPIEIYTNKYLRVYKPANRCRDIKENVYTQYKRRLLQKAI